MFDQLKKYYVITPQPSSPLARRDLRKIIHFEPILVRGQNGVKIYFLYNEK